jgi:hypothetical protein
MKGPPTILSGTLTSYSLWQLMQHMYWRSFLAGPRCTATWTFCLTLQCGHSTVISLAVIPATRSNVGINSLPASDLDTNPCPHGFVPTLNLRPSWTVKNTILVEGAIRRISVAASIPFMTGMLMSSRTISGFNSITFSTASLPFWASPQTWKECQSRSSRMVVRATRWSSTIRILADNLGSELKSPSGRVGSPVRAFQRLHFPARWLLRASRAKVQACLTGQLFLRIGRVEQNLPDYRVCQSAP